MKFLKYLYYVLSAVSLGIGIGYVIIFAILDNRSGRPGIATICISASGFVFSLIFAAVYMSIYESE